MRSILGTGETRKYMICSANPAGWQHLILRRITFPRLESPDQTPYLYLREDHQQAVDFAHNKEKSPLTTMRLALAIGSPDSKRFLGGEKHVIKFPVTARCDELPSTQVAKKILGHESCAHPRPISSRGRTAYIKPGGGAHDHGQASSSLLDRPSGSGYNLQARTVLYARLQ